MNDKEIVRRAKSGDERAFEQLVLEYENKVYNLAYRYTNNEFDARDISQEVFLRVYRFLGQFNEDSQFSTWLFRVASNVCKDTLRKKYAKNEMSFSAVSEDDEEYSFDVPDLKYNPENELEKSEMRREISEGLQNISAEHREILIMRDVIGLPYENIAQVLELEEGTVKSRISRAREKMRIQLEKNGNFFRKNTSNKI